MCNPISNFERWWIEQGRFLPPLDGVAGQAGDAERTFMAFAKKVAKACETEVDAAYKEGQEDAKMTVQT